MGEALLEVDDLGLSFRVPGGGRLRAVDQVSLRVATGEIVGLVGESGCGKSTLARCIAGQLRPERGEVRLAGVPLGDKRTPLQRRQVQLVFQNPYSSLNPRRSVGQTLRELIRVHHLVPKPAVEGRCRELMSLVGLPPTALDGLPGQFSGGQRQRIAISRALAVEPKVLVADEPVSALDVSVQATILRLFEDLRNRLDLGIIFISHDLAVIRQVSDHVAVMYLGRIVEQGPRPVIFEDPRHPYTQALLASAPRRGRRLSAQSTLGGEPPSPIDLPTGCSFRPRCPLAQEICQLRDPHLLAVRPRSDHVVSCHFGHDDDADLASG